MALSQGRSIKSLLGILSILLIGQSVLLVALDRRLKSVFGEQEQRLIRFSSGVSERLEAIESWAKFTTDNSGLEPSSLNVPTIGGVKPSVEIVEFADFECPACATVSEPLKKFIEAKGDSVRLRFVHFPIASLHPNAYLTAIASECLARSGQFWEFHDSLFANQVAVAQEADAVINRIAINLGHDSETLTECMRSPEARERVDAGRRLGQRFMITATPTFFINGKRTQGSNWSLLQDAIEYELRDSNGSQPARVSRVAITGVGAVSSPRGRAQ